MGWNRRVAEGLVVGDGPGTDAGTVSPGLVGSEAAVGASRLVVSLSVVVASVTAALAGPATVASAAPSWQPVYESAAVYSDVVAVTTSAPGDVWSVRDVGVDVEVLRTFGGVTTTMELSQWMTFGEVHPADILALAPDDVWVVGTDSLFNGCCTQPWAAHFDGTDWVEVPVPGNLADAAIYSIDGRAGDDVWMTGRANNAPTALLLHWDGTSLRRVGVPRPSPVCAFPNEGSGQAVALSADRLWLGVRCMTSSYVLVRNARGVWSGALTLDENRVVQDLDADSAGRVWVYAQADDNVAIYTGTDSLTPYLVTDLKGRYYFVGIAAEGGQVYLAGWYRLGPRPAIARVTTAGLRLEDVFRPATGDMTMADVTVDAAGTAWAVGNADDPAGTRIVHNYLLRRTP